MDKQTIRVALLFGGVSSEHEVSRVSAAHFARVMQGSRYEVIPVGITKDGRWLLCQGSPEEMADGSWESVSTCSCVLSPDRSHHGLLKADGQVIPVDVVLPVLHGRNGEDGRVPALCQLAGIPFVGCDMLSGAICMDKAVANTLLDAAGIQRCEWTWCSRAQWDTDPDGVISRVEEKLCYPIFVKPANAGSSVGISKAPHRGELLKAVETALAEDDKVVFERFVKGHEVECAVIGNGANVTATLPGEILAGDEFYTYDDKYVNGVSQTIYPARLSKEKLNEVRCAAEAAYRALGCRGLSRCDFFVEEGTQKVLINEINTMPGFTPISMYPKLMEAEGTDMPTLIDRIVQLALESAQRDLY